MSGAYLVPHEYEIEDYEEFMNEYRYIICHIVEVERAFPWLRHRKVINQFDEEIILGTHNYSFLRSGHMVDLLMKRGKNGFNALLEHIEYDYPDLFEKFTGKKPRQPDFQLPYRTGRTSTLIMAQINSLNQHLLQSYQEKQENLKILGITLKTLEDQVTEFQNELDMKNQQIFELSQKNLETNEKCNDLQMQLYQEKQDKSMYIEECNRLRKAKDEYQEKCNKMASVDEKYSMQGATPRQPSLRDQNRNKLHQELVQLRQEVEKLRSNSNLVTKEDHTNDMIKRQKAEIERLIEAKEKVEEEKEDLQEEVDRLQRLCTLNKNSNHELNKQFDNMKTERDEILSKLKQQEKKCEKLNNRNMSLKGEVQERDTNLRHLINEAETHGYRPRLPPLNSPSRKMPPRLPHRVPPDFSYSTSELRGGNDHYDEICDSCRDHIEPAEDSETEETDPPKPSQPPRLYPRTLSQPGSMTRNNAILRFPSTNRDASPRCRTGKRKHPLVLFSPKEIQKQLEKILLQSDAFKESPYETLRDEKILAAWLEGGSCIHYSRVGDHYLCIATQKLREEIIPDDGSRILLSGVTPEAIQRMLNQRISPIVMVVKYEDLEKREMKSHEEEELNRVHKDFHCQYEKILVDRKPDISSIARSITIKCAAQETSSRSGVYSSSGCNSRVTSTSSA